MNNALYESYRTLARGTPINSVTLLSTDYLNHFNEAVMLLEIVPDMPDMLDDVREWQPKTYQEHFADSQFKMRDLAIEAYDASPPEFRQPFDATIVKLNRMVAEAVDTVGTAIAAGDPERLQVTVSDTTAALRAEIDRAGAIVNGSAERMDQDSVDALFDETDGEAAAAAEGDSAETSPAGDSRARPAKGLFDIDVPFDVAIAFSRGMAALLSDDPLRSETESLNAGN